MDSFDTILEQLNQAKDRGKSAIEGRVETIAERLNQLVEEATASVRETMAHEAEELFPSDEFQQALEGLQARISTLEQEKAGLSQELEIAQGRLSTDQVEPESALKTGGISLDLLRTLDQARSQSELLKGLLPVLCDAVARAVVLVIRGGEVSAWSGIGFADGESLRQWQTSVPASPALHALVADSRPIRFSATEDEVFNQWLQAEGYPKNALLIPVCLRGQLMGCLYLDDGVDGPWNPESAQALVAVACWMIDTLNVRQEVPSPMVAEATVFGTASDVSSDVETVEPVFEEPLVDISEAEVEDNIDETPRAEEPESPLAPGYGDDAEVEEVEPAGPAIQDFDPSATMRVEVAQDLVEAAPEYVDEAVVEEPEPEPESEPEPEPEPEPQPEQEDELGAAEVVPPPPSPAVVPPAPLEPVAEQSTESGRSSEDQARHEEARRFARLLISEIKLYNEEEVERGCAGKDLYQRLQDDIDRSREMYDKRISEDIRTETDYFKDEMVRILANGDEDALGGYGP